jgi:hypothetical protein
MHEIEREILEITHYKIQRKFSGRQDYLKSIFNAVQKLKNDEFDELTDEAALWANACVESYNRDKDAELPDFNEVGDPDDADVDSEDNGQEEPVDDEVEDEDGSEDLSDSDDDEGDNQGSDEQPEMETEDEAGVQLTGLEEEVDEPEDTAPRKKTKRIKEPKIKKPTKPPPVREDDDSDVELDKWGSMVGSKNSRALSMFEKGATAGEVKDQLGGTYYNILKKMVSHGHKLEKNGAVITLIHLTEKRSRVSSPKRSKK